MWVAFNCGRSRSRIFGGLYIKSTLFKNKDNFDMFKI